MFGSITSFFAALARLTASVNKSADLFDVANVELEKRLSVEEPLKVEANGHARRRLPVEK